MRLLGVVQSRTKKKKTLDVSGVESDGEIINCNSSIRMF
jgi:hypothetical protein